MDQATPQTRPTPEIEPLQNNGAHLSQMTLGSSPDYGAMARELAAAAEEIFRDHVDTAVSGLGDRLRDHVEPTILLVTGAADRAIKTIETVNLSVAAARESMLEMQGAVGDAKITLDNVASTVTGTGAMLQERISEVDALVRNGADRHDALRAATHMQIIDAIRSLRGSEDEGDGELARELELEAQLRHKHFPLLHACMEAGVPAWLHGEAGSGKSTAAKQVAELYGLNFYPIAISPTTTPAVLNGYMDAGGTYRASALRLAVEEGGVVLLDEADNGLPGTLTPLNNVLSNGGGIFPDSIFVHVHERARFIVGANTIGKGPNARYVGRNTIDAATLDRFAFVPWDIDDQLENALAGVECEAPQRIVDIGEGGIPTPKTWLETVRSARTAVQELGMDQVVTTRAVIFGNKLARVGVGISWLAEMLLLKGMRSAERNKLLGKMGLTGSQLTGV